MARLEPFNRYARWGWKAMVAIYMEGRTSIIWSAVLIGVEVLADWKWFHVISSPLQVPSAFRNALWLLAPPKKLEPGQHDLLHEAEVRCVQGQLRLGPWRWNENNEVKITHSWIFHGMINYKNIVSKNPWKKWVLSDGSDVDKNQPFNRSPSRAWPVRVVELSFDVARLVFCTFFLHLCLSSG